MSRSARRLPKWLELVLSAMPGVVIVLMVWPSATSSGARFLVGVLVGLCVALLVAGLLALAEENGRRHRTNRTRHP